MDPFGYRFQGDIIQEAVTVAMVTVVTVAEAAAATDITDRRTVMAAMDTTDGRTVVAVGTCTGVPCTDTNRMIGCHDVDLMTGTRHRSVVIT